jgi:hypothetical protein
MLNLKEVKKIRKRFEAGKADKPMRIEGDHIKDDDMVLDLGWRVLSAEGHGMPFGDGQEASICYATGATFEAATFLVHLPVDMAHLLDDLERIHLLIAGLIAGDAEAVEVAEDFVLGRVREGREEVSE